MTRHFWVLPHRYAGLMMALFLIVAGLTGSILAFYHELDDWLNPQNFNAPIPVAVQAEPLLDTIELCERALKLVPHARINMVDLEMKPDKAYSVFLLIPTTTSVVGNPNQLDFDNLVLKLNPYTGDVIQRSVMPTAQEGYFPLTRKNVLKFIYALHYQLALGEIGGWVMGIAALIWTIDCFVGFYLTFPLRRKQSHTFFKSALFPSPAREPPVKENNNDNCLYPSHPSLLPQVLKGKSFWSRWKPSWLVKWHSSLFRVNFDLHRAGGLWVWPMLLILAWSSVGFNLNEQIFTPVMKAMFNMPEEPFYALPTLAKPVSEPVLDWQEARRIGQRLMAEQANIHGFKVQEEVTLEFVPEKGVFMYIVSSDRDIVEAGGDTLLLFDSTTDTFIGLSFPTGQNAGTTFKNWVNALHMASVWGLPYKMFLCFVGIVITMLSVTGVYIWLKKRRAARVKRNVLV